MATHEELEVYRQLRAAQEKYIYFLLAAVGACLAFSLSQTNQAPLSMGQIPLAIAVSMWGISFFCGCKYLHATESITYANSQFLKAENGTHPISGQNPAYIQATLLAINSSINSSGVWAARYKSGQFYFFIGAVIFYIIWHALEMWARTNA